MNKYLFFLLLACFITSMTLSLETLDKENNESPKLREWLIQYYWWQTNDREQAEAFDGKGELPAFLKPVITMHIIRHDNEQIFSIAKAGKHVLGAKVTPAPKSAKLSTKLFLFYSNEEIKARGSAMTNIKNNRFDREGPITFREIEDSFKKINEKKEFVSLTAHVVEVTIRILDEKAVKTLLQPYVEKEMLEKGPFKIPLKKREGCTNSGAER
jgi:hypothetical protein